LRELAALPVLAARPAGDFARFTTFPEHWALGYEFMERNRDRYHLLFVLGRLPMVALALGLVVAVYLCGARHLGTRAGLAAAALATFCPTVLAHGHLVGTDVGAALGMFLAVWAAFEALGAPTAGRTLLAGLAVGAAELTKFSALTLYPMLAVLALVACVRGPRRWQPWAVVAAAGALSLVVVNAGYLAHGSGTPLAAYTLKSPGLRALAGGPLGAFLLVPPGLFTTLFAGLTDIDLGIRYLLPAYPFLFLVAGAALASAVTACLARAGAALVLLHALVAAPATPAHLAYMNALAGPPDTRWRWLVDSNLDWGQELLRLRAYLARRGMAQVGLVYFGRVAPEVYGIDYRV